MRPPTSTPDVFVIRGGGDAFAIRQKKMFEQLLQAAKAFNKDEGCSTLNQTEMEILCGRVVNIRSPRSFDKKNRNITTQYRGKESIFKRPEGPTPLVTCKSIPDHHRNPHKWIKYSLEDVQNEQMSDRSNAQAAFSFLRELRARKATQHSENAKEEDTDSESLGLENSSISAIRCKATTHIPFRKMLTNEVIKEPSIAIVKHDNRPVFRNSKIILPEYVVGQKVEKKAKTVKPVVKVDRSKQLKLDHLEELDD